MTTPLGPRLVPSPDASRLPHEIRPLGDDDRRNRPTVAIDFDGVIHAYSKGWHDGTIYDEPKAGAFSSLQLLMHLFNVYIFTSRDSRQVAQWLSEKGGFNCRIDMGPDILARKFWNDPDFLLITDRKLPAIAYIDDRGIRFTSWTDALQQLGNIAGEDYKLLARQWAAAQARQSQ